MREQDVMLGEGAGLVSRCLGWPEECVTAIPRAPVCVPTCLTMSVRSSREEAGDGWCWVMFG